MKATKNAAKKAYNFAIGDDIKTLKNPKSKWYQKAGAVVSIASNFIPGAKGVTLGAKAAIKVGTKSPKLAKLAANSIKITRNNKLKNGGTPTKYRTIPKLTQPVAGDNVGSMLRGPKKGGRFKDVDAVKGPDQVAHHLAQNTYNKRIGISRDNGSAVLMSKQDHAKTRTFLLGEERPLLEKMMNWA
ncbi:hypothetical protein CU633_09975 [Bacillus sp. V3-13]|uniref:hypothetical protein n=1 Tax=Bacillus sp. V3-13 TaxID=2053728 RepID=UPI000C78C222|nr:hypothetical protein [Bacillus sp. V3-13]PLR77518.1 hypothetical protein CU633_09975 [Bacillus sp. V3-13]